ncbi:MAG: EcsC family protein [Lachnospiraceae bacterium]|nr:EcsC family protein [Lachnospiraceae bacterium]
MALFQKKTPLEKEWEKLMKEERKFLLSRAEKKDSLLNQKLEQFVPDKLQETLDTAFAKAFGLIFDKGTGVIEKTYNKDEMEKRFQINQFASDLRKDSRSLKKFSKKARQSGNINVLVSGTAGIGMGVLGVGIPDIPVFLGMVLKSVYEIAINYGYRYDTPEEQYFILLLIETAVSHGRELIERNQEIDDYIKHEKMPEPYNREVQIKLTSAMLSKELLYMKFLQGVPVVGAVGGAYDVVYLKQITEYANMKYKRRFLTKKRLES